jgi:hypothetical protein
MTGASKRWPIPIRALARTTGLAAVLVVAATADENRLDAQQPQPQQPQPLARPPIVVTTNPADRPSPPQPHQTQGVEYFLGSWRFSWTGRESAITAGPRAGKVVFSRMGESNFLEMKADGTIEGGGPYKESGVAAWSPAGNTFVLQEKLANGMDMLSVGDWSSPIAIRFDAQPIKSGAQTLRLRRTYNIVSAGAFNVIEELSIDGKPTSVSATGTSRKNSRSASHLRSLPGRDLPPPRCKIPPEDFGHETLMVCRRPHSRPVRGQRIRHSRRRADRS